MALASCNQRCDAVIVDEMSHKVMADLRLGNNIPDQCSDLSKHPRLLSSEQPTSILLSYAYRMKGGEFQIIDFEVDDKDVVTGALELMKTLRPQWKTEDIKTTTFTDGITNKLVGCRHKSDDKKTDMILVRVYGEKTELIIDRDLEMLNMRLLHAAGCCEPLYCKFNNGLCYGFSPGMCLDEKLVRDPTISRLIAKEMVKVQNVNPLEILKRAEGDQEVEFNTEPNLFKKAFQLLSQVPDEFPDPRQNERYKKDIRSKTELEAELKEMQQVLEPLNCPVVFSHNDLLLKNIVYNEEKERVFFIDFEYGAYNYYPYEIANHFCEYAGVDTVDYSLYPDKDYQLKWLRTFLEFKLEADGKKACEVTEHDLEVLYVQVNKFALMGHLFWGLWGLVQARHSLIDFDYLDYAKIRLDEYFARKDELLALEIPSVKSTTCI